MCSEIDINCENSVQYNILKIIKFCQVENTTIGILQGSSIGVLTY